MIERQYWLGFSLVAGVGPVRIRRLLEHFGSLKEAWEGSSEALRSSGLDQRTLANLSQVRQQADLSAELARLDKLGMALLTWDDPEYPPLLAELKQIDQAPPVLYLRGTLTDSDRWAVAVVGTRSISPYGRQVTYQIVRELASNGITIVSGLARGIDAEAHMAALATGSRTIAVMPCGLDRVYPVEHRKLASQIVDKGALVSVFPLGTQAESKNFAPRNQVMSGLARGVLVAEAKDRSGALMTARYALEQGREVFAVPGNITAQGSAGTNKLIQDGAHPVLSGNDVLDVLNLGRVPQYEQARTTLPPMGSDEQAVLECIAADPIHIDELTRLCSLPVARVTIALTMLELKGVIRQVGSMTFVRH